MPWASETIVTGIGGTTAYVGLAIDVTAIHAAFYNGNTMQLGYATRNTGGGAWTVEDPTLPPPWAGWSQITGLSIAVDSGIPYIVTKIYGHPTLPGNPPSVDYHVRSGGTWVTTNIDTCTNPDLANVSLIFDGSGVPHVAYTDYDPIVTSTLKYAYLNGGIWNRETITTIDSSIAGFSNPTIVTDSSNIPHIIYITQTGAFNRIIHHTWRSTSPPTPGTWNDETLEIVGEQFINERCAAFDSSGNLHIVYYDYTNDLLRYAIKSGGSWNIGTITTYTTGSNNLTRQTIALDSMGNPHIVYILDEYVGLPNTIVHAWEYSGTWSSEVIDTVTYTTACNTISYCLATNFYGVVNYQPLAGVGEGKLQFFSITVTPSPIGNFAVVYGYCLDPVTGLGGSGSGEPISGATVTIGGQVPAVSDGTGFYSVYCSSDFNTPGTPVTAWAPRMSTIETAMEVPVNTSTEIIFFMQPTNVSRGGGSGGGSRVRRSGGTFRNPLNMLKGLKL